MATEEKRVSIEEKKVTANHNTGLLWAIAVVCMIFDHTGAIFFKQAIWMRVIGRIALPLFAWGIAVGAEHTRNIRRYALRLFALMIISQPFFMGALNHPASTATIMAFLNSIKLNIFATLFLGLVAIWGLKEKKEWMTIIAMMLSHLISMDYGLSGVLCILILWALHDKPLPLAICFCAYCVIWGGGSYAIWRTDYFTLTLQMSAMLALPLILWPTATRLRMPKWLTYAMYPGHLAILWILKEIFL